MKWEIIFYESPSGQPVIERFIDSLQKKPRGELLRELDLLEEYGIRYNVLESEYRLASSLIKARIEKRLTQQQLADIAGVTQNTITRLESGTTNPTIGTLTRVASALGKEIRLVGTR